MVYRPIKIACTPLLCGLLVLCLLFTGVVAATSLQATDPATAMTDQRPPYKVLRLVSESWPPFAYECDSKACGVDVELVAHVLATLGYQIQIQFVPWPRALARIQAGEADAILDISKGESNEREHSLLFPSEPLSISSHSLFYRKSEPFVYEGLTSLRGKRVAVVRGYNYSANFMSAAFFSRDPGVGHEQNMKKLVRGRVDLALMDTAVGIHLIRTLDVEDQIAKDPTLFISGKLYLAFASRPEYANLVSGFERELIAFKRTVDYEKLLLRYGLSPEQEGMQ
jgi:polar amino acid transport system substrate-binding protein